MSKAILIINQRNNILHYFAYAHSLLHTLLILLVFLSFIIPSSLPKGCPPNPCRINAIDLYASLSFILDLNNSIMDCDITGIGISLLRASWTNQFTSPVSSM